MLKLYVVVNDTNIYELIEQQPVLIENEKAPIKLLAKNGFHYSLPLIITDDSSSIQLIGVGCTVDNGKLLGCIFLSIWLFILYYATGNYGIMALANLPILYVMYYFFGQPKNFLTLKLVKKKQPY